MCGVRDGLRARRCAAVFSRVTPTGTYPWPTHYPPGCNYIDDNEPGVSCSRDETRRVGTLQSQEVKNGGARFIVPVKRTDFSSINK